VNAGNGSRARRLRVGVIGAGGVTVQHLPPLGRLGRTELVGVASRTPERASAVVAQHGGVAYTDAQQMLEAQRPDIAFVCLPPHRRPDHHAAARRRVAANEVDSHLRQ
jgi:predicted dehydrogenase